MLLWFVLAKQFQYPKDRIYYQIQLILQQKYGEKRKIFFPTLLPIKSIIIPTTDDMIFQRISNC